MDDPIPISVKNMAALMLPTTCMKCFWLRLRVGFKGVWEIFGPIYSLLDLYVKHHVQAILEEKGSVPAWMPCAADIVGSVKPTRLTYVVAGANVQLRGVPDGLFKLKEGRFILVDFKTGKCKGEDDPLLPLYVGQLNAYAWILTLQYKMVTL